MRVTDDYRIKVFAPERHRVPVSAAQLPQPLVEPGVDEYS
jgi:hypothetical protein